MARATLAWAGLLLGLAAPADAALEIEGTWHVVVHYKDSQAHNQDAERWEDRVWVLQRQGERLRWTEYPIVVFDDDAGRFERTSTSRAARVLGYWEPNPGQLAELAAGPKVNQRGSRSKSLVLSNGSWRSTGTPAVASASTITFVANWSIEDPAGVPTFRMEDVLGSGTSGQLEGGTLFDTDSVEQAGEVLRGRFDRDGARIGTFTARRTPPVRGLGTREEQEARIRVKLRALFGLDALEGTQSGELTEPQRQELRREISRALADGAQTEGRPLSEEQLEGLTDRVQELLEQGRTPEQIERMFERGEIVP